MLTRADELEPNNPLAKFHKANLYVSLEEYELALLELEQVKEFAPREASVHFLMGRIHKRLNQPDAAMMRFITALDLDPKDRNLVKSAIDKLHAPNGEDDDEEF
jgi:anaphase-promoting complex subunit 3